MFVDREDAHRDEHFSSFHGFSILRPMLVLERRP
jgi:hypothetical protein